MKRTLLSPILLSPILTLSLLGASAQGVAAEPTEASAGTIQVRAAGSLKAALTELITAYEKESGGKVAAEFGPSGLLKDRIEQGEAAALFASANMKHPEALLKAGIGLEVRPFARNELCALARPGLSVNTETLLSTLLAADVVVGMSTPKADPAGDYAVAVFELAEQQRAGAAAALKVKARQLTGGPSSAKAPDGVNPYAHVMRQQQADVFLTYCTNGRLAQAEFAALQLIPLPDYLRVGADYGVLLLDERARPLADYLISAKGQAILASFGFAGPAPL
ncbi:molybdate ABC transporter substrate-binding protein [Shewanella sp. JM162201]|uniref:Molybdate ABC transporter substrate-binding protein n=1 Tax=Shewanella jiangmenensis TaxID=2837387 RepID=A0ABS5V2L5_9GAMM|nr:molybdate ABC transporter substrate-binding protein [Shewanella jiangmenensis]MBT1443914.1 molybdate ABC transporter substrate-binding protein [Shewanella jiangmenensis]